MRSASGNCKVITWAIGFPELTNILREEKETRVLFVEHLICEYLSCISLLESVFDSCLGLEEVDAENSINRRRKQDPSLHPFSIRDSLVVNRHLFH